MARRLLDLYPEVVHVIDLRLEAAEDGEIWSFARDHGWTICSKDTDFVQRSLAQGHPPRVVWVRLANCTSDAVEAVFRSRWVEINRFHEAEDRSTLALG